METKNLEQVKDLILEIDDDTPTKEQVQRMNELTGIDWSIEDLKWECHGCSWDFHTLEESAYCMFHKVYPPGHCKTFVFWKYKPGIITDNNILTTHYDFDDSHSTQYASEKDHVLWHKYQLGRDRTDDLEALPLWDIIKSIQERYPNWYEKDPEANKHKVFCFTSLQQENYWMDTSFSILQYDRFINSQEETQMLEFSCHNMTDDQMKPIFECMAYFQCSLHWQEDENW